MRDPHRCWPQPTKSPGQAVVIVARTARGPQDVVSLSCSCSDGDVLAFAINRHLAGAGVGVTGDAVGDQKDGIRGVAMATVSVRYIVDDVDAAVAFYCQQLGFREEMHPAPAFAMLSRGELRLLLSAPGGGPGGGQAMPDGSLPEPGGWNRFQLEVADLAAAVDTLRSHGARFRNDLVVGVGGKQILLEDPSGNPIELFEPTSPEPSLSPHR
jgi:catechol 2,3-dioxygenase-like lactoylglutathione lyase family enzyme